LLEDPRAADTPLEGRVAIVTGAAQGIGESIATFLASAGASVLLADVQEERVGAVANGLRDQGLRGASCFVDISDPSSAGSMVTSCLEEFGSVDILVNNAGIVGLVKALTVDVPAVRFSAVTPAWPVPEEPWYSADVDWRVASSASDTSGILRAVADTVVFLANDKEGYLRGQVIRIPSDITT
jgi:hypothetical protein